ncbi:MAG: hypothetical protein J07AB43_00460 [Candidatus Nanosalina sp. J07AB43]|jgi:hypothetical protein|nr:MAG: hypothetical protein J07AB43_00460 [Candidatus Nanosalina sp. J07AB43]
MTEENNTEVDAPFVLGLTRTERDDLKFALEIAMERAHTENDSESVTKFNGLYKRIHDLEHRTYQQ